MEINKINEEALKCFMEDMKGGKAVLLDVRTKEEWDTGHAENAIHFELARLEAGELPEIPKDKAICVYCAAGGRAEAAKSILASKGFSNVKNIGGLRDWKLAGGKVIT
ncbi:MAG: rhodanese domain-containing protein [Parcubacteria group bacterium LiPW_15]|nr:MAG: rhodanese domain-containing protein [Parcubacteria group bacterium LiPW_15]